MRRRLQLGVVERSLGIVVLHAAWVSAFEGNRCHEIDTHRIRLRCRPVVGSQLGSHLERTGRKQLVGHIADILPRRIAGHLGHTAGSSGSGIRLDHSLRIAGSSGRAGKIAHRAGKNLRLVESWPLLLLLLLRLAVAAEVCCSSSSAGPDATDPLVRRDHLPRN